MELITESHAEVQCRERKKKNRFLHDTDHICYVIDSWVFPVCPIAVCSYESISVSICQITVHLLFPSLFRRTLPSVAAKHTQTHTLE